MMVYLILLSALVFIPTSSTFVDAVRIPQLAYLSILAVVCVFSIRETPLLRLWLLYLGMVSLSGFAAQNLGMFVSRFSLDVIGVVFFWHFASARIQPERMVFAVVAIALLVSWVPEYMSFESAAGIWAMAAPLAAYGFVTARGMVSGLYAMGMWGALLAIFLLGRRADIFAVVLAGVVGLTSLRRKWTAIFVLVCGLLVMFPILVQRGAVDLEQPRVEYWRYGAQIVAEHPILGVGRGNLPIALYPYARYGNSTRYGGDYSAKDILAFLHSDYFDLLAEAGPVALLAYVCLLVSLLRRTPTTAWQAALYAALLTIPIRGLFHSVLLSPAQATWFWTLAGIYWRLKDDETKPNFLVFANNADRVHIFDGATLSCRSSVRSQKASLGFHAVPVGLSLSVQRGGGASDPGELSGGRGLLSPHRGKFPDVAGG